MTITKYALHFAAEEHGPYPQGLEHYYDGDSFLEWGEKLPPDAHHGHVVVAFYEDDADEADVFFTGVTLLEDLIYEHRVYIDLAATCVEGQQVPFAITRFDDFSIGVTP